MSQYYDLGDRTLWNPSNGASWLFMSQVTVYQAEVGLPSGIGPMDADECQIDPVAFAAFVDALLAWHSETRHAVMATMSEGFVATVLALAEIANIEVSWQGPSAPRVTISRRLRPPMQRSGQAHWSRSHGSLSGTWRPDSRLPGPLATRDVALCAEQDCSGVGCQRCAL